MNWDGLLIIFAGTLVAFVNGTNDVSKGIATLVGSGVTDYRRALRWGTLWTAIGGLAGALFAGAMVTTFGKGLLASGVTPVFPAAVAAILGAAVWVLIATRTGLPVSTTHAIVGSVIGVAAFAYGFEGVRWISLAGKVVLPLLLSPFLSLALTVAVLRIFRSLRAGAPAKDCVCAEVQVAALPSAIGVQNSGIATLPLVPHLAIRTGTSAACAERSPVLKVTSDHLHWLTSGATSFARGMNDAPKMVALVLAASALSQGVGVGPNLAFLLITAGMVFGSVIGGRRVTRVLAQRVTPMNHQEGFIANLVTSILVSLGAVAGLPMSTTHVSSGGIIGAGAQRSPRELNLSTVRAMLLAWFVTVPASALLGVGAFRVARLLQG